MEEIDDIEDAFEGKLFEEECVALIVIGTHSFGITIDHGNRKSLMLEFPDCLYAAPVELHR
jgi:hypothetical protein